MLEDESDHNKGQPYKDKNDVKESSSMKGQHNLRYLVSDLTCS